VSDRAIPGAVAAWLGGVGPPNWKPAHCSLSETGIREELYQKLGGSAAP
jgi:hypothetical protein